MREAIAGKNNPKYRHGGKGTRLYNIWKGVRKRCLNEKSGNYKIYGGRGIKISKERDDFVSFRDWSLANGYADNLSIDRIDNNKDYSPENCRWADRFQQSANRSNVRQVVACGESFIISTFSRRFGISENTTTYWLDRGFNGDQILERFKCQISA